MYATPVGNAILINGTPVDNTAIGVGKVLEFDGTKIVYVTAPAPVTITGTITEAQVVGLVADLSSLNSGKASASTVTAHIANVSNPHAVTAAQTGALALTGGTLTGGLTGTTLTMAGQVHAANNSWTIDGAGNAVFNAEVDCGSILNAGLFYSKSSMKIWNKANNGYIFWATRNESGSEVVYDLSNIGAITGVGSVISGVGSITFASGIGNLNMNQRAIVMNDTSGSGGSTLYMDGGSIVGANDITSSGTVSANGFKLGSNNTITGGSGQVLFNIPTGQTIFLNGSAGNGGTFDFDWGNIDQLTSIKIASDGGRIFYVNSGSTEVSIISTNGGDQSYINATSGSFGSSVGTGAASLDDAGNVYGQGQLTVLKSARTGVSSDVISGSYSPNVDTANQFNVTMEGTVILGAWLGSPADGQGVIFKFIQSGQSLVFDSTYWNVMAGVTVPPTISNDVYVTAVFNSLSSKFDVIGATGTV